MNLRGSDRAQILKSASAIDISRPDNQIARRAPRRAWARLDELAKGSPDPQTCLTGSGTLAIGIPHADAIAVPGRSVLFK